MNARRGKNDSGEGQAEFSFGAPESEISATTNSTEARKEGPDIPQPDEPSDQREGSPTTSRHIEPASSAAYPKKPTSKTPPPASEPPYLIPGNLGIGGLAEWLENLKQGKSGEPS